MPEPAPGDVPPTVTRDLATGPESPRPESAPDSPSPLPPAEASEIRLGRYRIGGPGI